MNSPALRLRIALAIGIYQPDGGGAAEWLRAYALWLQQRGHDVTILCERMELSSPSAIPLLPLPPAKHTKNSWRRAKALQALVQSHRCDVVHDSGCLLTADVYHPLMGSLMHNWYRQLKAYPLALRLRRCFQIRMWRDVRLQLHQQRQPQFLIACSQRVAADFGGLGCPKTIIIHNGIPLAPAVPPADLQALRHQLNVGSRLLVVVTATNFYLKGVMGVLQALAHLEPAEQKRFLVIVTGSIQDAVFQSYIDRHQLGATCRLVGWVGPIDAYYQAADVFLHPTYHDAGSLSTLKALAAGCAVVTSRFDGSSDWITHGIDGLILKEPGNVGELAETFRRLLNDALRTRLGTAARLLAPVIHQDHQFKKLEALYFRMSHPRTA